MTWFEFVYGVYCAFLGLGIFMLFMFFLSGSAGPFTVLALVVFALLYRLAS